MPKRTFKDRMTLFSGPDAVELHYFGRGHTDGDAWVLIPSALGLAARATLGPARVRAAERGLRVAAPATLVALCYANASSCLPQALGSPDWDFLAIVVAFVGGLCLLSFAAGFAVGFLAGADRGQRVALVYALGMNNNGTGLVLASIALTGHPDVMLPVIAYNLIQQVIAASIGAVRARLRPAA